MFDWLLDLRDFLNDRFTRRRRYGYDLGLRKPPKSNLFTIYLRKMRYKLQELFKEEWNAPKNVVSAQSFSVPIIPSKYKLFSNSWNSLPKEQRLKLISHFGYETERKFPSDPEEFENLHPSSERRQFFEKRLYEWFLTKRRFTLPQLNNGMWYVISSKHNPSYSDHFLYNLIRFSAEGAISYCTIPIKSNWQSLADSKWHIEKGGELIINFHGSEYTFLATVDGIHSGVEFIDGVPPAKDYLVLLHCMTEVNS